MRSEPATGHILDILKNIDLATEFLGPGAMAAFEGDLLRVYAVTRCIEVISEASRSLPAELKERHPHIPWREMAGAGNIYRHDYQDVAPQILWDTVRLALPPLREALEIELAGRVRPD